MRAEVEFIDAQKAQEYLARSKGNRPLSEKDVAKYVRDLKSGQFTLSPQGIAFDTDGTLIDGHHRLTAIARCGVGANILVVRDAPKESKTCIDTGKKRSTADILYFNGVFKDSPALRNKRVIACVSRVVRETSGYINWHLSTAEIIGLLTFFSCECEDLYKAAISRGGGVESPVAAAALAALIKGENKLTIIKFMNVYLAADISDCEDYNYQCVISFRRAIEDLRYKGHHMESSKEYNMAQNAIWNFTNKTKTKTIKATSDPRYDCKKEIDAFFEQFNG